MSRTAGCSAGYDGGHIPIAAFVPARQDLLPEGYAFGTIQTTRGCPLNCSFCQRDHVQWRPVPAAPLSEDVVEEFLSIPEKRVLVVDDNLIGTRPEHIARAKSLFRALIKAKPAQGMDRAGHHQFRGR